MAGPEPAGDRQRRTAAHFGLGRLAIAAPGQPGRAVGTARGTHVGCGNRRAGGQAGIPGRNRGRAGRWLCDGLPHAVPDRAGRCRFLPGLL
ncbi:hypothetical protein G6F40_017298 [Rhizopus arrhizus]|nr:hypothetical protein G6F40_017298 [Rhizopus arrhizus]